MDDDLVNAARAAGATTGHGEQQQLGHWARLGKQVDQVLDRQAVALVLAGHRRYDDLPDLEQAAVRVAWELAIEYRLGELDYEPALIAAGEPWVEADDDGNTVVRHGDR
ncbi:TA system antitoxin ParD family protein [Nocardioides sp. URHA0032]|uniref:TA system antitoxin ParD family protein n=1 Tax=Nocardioides sp. URHA0032 TaxID=1380388 RepID=UPI0018CC3CAE|nr:hypothetical protein [Nocardioides sp. URHA0032]